MQANSLVQIRPNTSFGAHVILFVGKKFVVKKFLKVHK